MERIFCSSVSKNGAKQAFLEFAADDAVLNRDGRQYKGKKEIEGYFDDCSFKTLSLDWEPERIEISESGDLAFSQGPYALTGLNEKNETFTTNGYYLTVWKKQKDGSWKYVCD